VGRSPYPLPPIYTKCYTFFKDKECIPDQAGAIKNLKDLKNLKKGRGAVQRMEWGYCIYNPEGLMLLYT
jgi:hypothetical protein|tara:strand:- start:63 stop:269 length:207 start_codon:yes stop_codon:yes gene_type:complete